MSWQGSTSFRGTTPGHRVSVYLHPEGHGGRLIASPSAADAPEWSTELKDWSPIADAATAALEAEVLAAARAEVPELESIALRSYPSLRFQVLDRDALHTVELELDGEMEVEAGGGAAPLRSKLLRLHVTHGNPGYTGVRWLWARVVDVMGCAMVLWGLTGLLMWWTLPTTRRTGAVALGLGVSLISTLAVSIWALLGML
jgi:hypothetical protein